MCNNIFKCTFLGVMLLTLVLAPAGWSGWLLTPEDEDTSSSTQPSQTTASSNKGAVGSGTAGSGSTSSGNTGSGNSSSGSGGFSSFQDEGTQTAPASATKGYEVSLLNAKKLNDNTIQLVWENPDNINNYVLTVYRGTNSLNTAQRLSQAKIVKQYSTASNSYFDRLTLSGVYFYAVTVTLNGSENKVLTPDQSQTTAGIPMTVTAPQVVVIQASAVTQRPMAVIPPQVKGLTGSLQNGNQVNLAWTVVPGSNVLYNIYRSKTTIAVSSDLKDLAGSVAGLSFQQALTQAGGYYYAVTAKNSVGENRRIMLATNSLSSALVYAAPATAVAATTPAGQPVVVQPIVAAKVTQAQAQVISVEATVSQKPVAAVAAEAVPELPAQTMTAQTMSVQTVSVPAVTNAKSGLKKDYDYIMLTVKRRYFYSEDYESAIDRLTALVEDPDCPAPVRSEAWLFLGKAYYYTREYAKALKIMVRMKSDFPDEADFWISRIAAKL